MATLVTSLEVWVLTSPVQNWIVCPISCAVLCMWACCHSPINVDWVQVQVCPSKCYGAESIPIHPPNLFELATKNSWITVCRVSYPKNGVKFTVQTQRAVLTYLHRTLCVPRCPLAANVRSWCPLYHVSAFNTVCAWLHRCHHRKKTCMRLWNKMVCYEIVLKVNVSKPHLRIKPHFLEQARDQNLTWKAVKRQITHSFKNNAYMYCCFSQTGIHYVQRQLL